MLFVAKSVADGSAHPKYVIGVEIGVVYDVVEVSFGAHKVVPPRGVADADAKVKEELIVVKVGGAT